MKKVVIGIVIIVGIINSRAFGAEQPMLTLIERDMSIVMSRSVGTRITLIASSGDIIGWTVEKGGITITNNEFIMPEEDVVIRVKYKITNHTITVIQGENGIISPGTEVVEGGTNKTYTITPNTGYLIEEVKVDNESIIESLNEGEGNTKTYTFNNVTKDHEIRAEYKAIVYTIITKEDEGGIIEGEYENHMCEECEGRDHECEVVNIFVKEEKSEVREERETGIGNIIITKEDEGGIIEGEYENHMCEECGGRDHECQVVNIYL